ncbi:MAG: alpha/beta hydrolase [bacterium]|nr:alpha/beta hydrolase [bacterium]
MIKKILTLTFALACFFVFPVYAEYQKVNSVGLDVHYRVFGEGEPLLIIGGGPGDSSDRYLSLCELLAPVCKCILVDQRGTGKSTPKPYDATTLSIKLTLQDFEAIRKKLGLKQWHALGFSYGGYIASAYAHNFPASVSSLVLLNSMGLNTGNFGVFLDNIVSRMRPSDMEKFEFWNEAERKKKYPNRSLVERIRARMPGYFYDHKKSLIVTEFMKESDFSFQLGNYVWAEVQALDLAKLDPKFSGPVLILAGRQDPLGESVPLTLERYYKKSKLVFVEKSGHYSWLEQPEKVKESIQGFLKKKG